MLMTRCKSCFPNRHFRGYWEDLFKLLTVFLGSGFLALSQPDQPVRKVALSRLVTQNGSSAVYLKTGPKVADVPFTGVAFVEEDWGRAEMTYAGGVLHGPVTVIVRNKLFSQFEYKNGQKVLPK